MGKPAEQAHYTSLARRNKDGIYRHILTTGNDIRSRHNLSLHAIALHPYSDKFSFSKFDHRIERIDKTSRTFCTSASWNI